MDKNLQALRHLSLKMQKVEFDITPLQIVRQKPKVKNYNEAL